MSDHADSTTPSTPGGIFGEMLKLQGEATQAMLAAFTRIDVPVAIPLNAAQSYDWDDLAARVRSLWLPVAGADASGPPDDATASWGTAAGALADPLQWRALVESWYQALPLGDAATRQSLMADSTSLWNSVLGQYGLGDAADNAAPELPRKDRRFADPRWRDQPVFALIHQSYLLLAEQLIGLAEQTSGVDPAQKDKLRFATRTLIEALSPANFPLTNPIVLERILETRGENLVAGMEHMLADLRKGQLTHTDSSAFEVGRNIAITPGKVVHETPMYQLIQYSPTTEAVLGVPLVIFPPWINRFYILDLNPAKSFVRWAAEQGITVFMVSWKSADASMADVVWDDYIRAQMDAIDTICARLKVPAVHAIGYCVAGTTLAATLAILARRGEADKVKSATFFTAQVDFELGGELKTFIDDSQLTMISGLARDGYLDGRYMAVTFNLLRSSDLIWNYVINNYLLGNEYPAFDLLHWNGDTTNLPVKWHQSYLRDLYRDNRLVEPDALSADGTPIDLTQIAVPVFIQAGREDHIAPPQSVWRIMDHVRSQKTFVLAGSGHIAGVVNPPAAKKYQYWTNDGPAASYEEFVAGAQEHPGSWWDYWCAWLRALEPAEVPATGKRAPGGKGDRVIEDAPGRYVLT